MFLDFKIRFNLISKYDKFIGLIFWFRFFLFDCSNGYVVRDLIKCV